jgi:hypothetical protein
MWIITTDGFYSIVQKPWDVADDTLTVRARVREDLERFIDTVHAAKTVKAKLDKHRDIIEDRAADYAYRIQVPRDTVLSFMARSTANIDYYNFKDAVATQASPRRAAAYSRVWAHLLELQRPDNNQQHKRGVPGRVSHGGQAVGNAAPTRIQKYEPPTRKARE